MDDEKDRLDFMKQVGKLKNQIASQEKKLKEMKKHIEEVPETILEVHSDLLKEGIKSKRSFKAFLKSQITIGNIAAILFLLTFIFTLREAREKYTQYVHQDAMIEAMVATSYRLASEGIFREPTYFDQALEVLDQAESIDKTNPYIFSARFFVEGSKELVNGREEKLINYIQFQKNISSTLKNRSFFERKLTLDAKKVLIDLDKPSLARMHVLLGERLRQKGRYPYALDIIEKGITYAKESGHRGWLVNSFMTKSNTYLSASEYDEAVNTLDELEPILLDMEKSNDPKNYIPGLDGMGALLQQRGIINHESGNYNDALKDYKLSLGKYDDLKKKNPKRDNILSRGKVYHQIGLSFFRLNKLKEAEDAFNKSISFKNKTEDKYGLMKTHTELGRLHNLKSNKKKTEEHLLLALNYAKELNNNDELDYIQGIMKSYNISEP